jgi:hypothetical protein
MTRARKLLLTARARAAGARYAYRIIDEAVAAELPPALALALVDQESGFRNVFGHDPVANPVKSPPGGTLRVTRRRYRRYLTHRHAGEGMQGVGPAQLTWWQIQDEADREGGCWKIRPNLRVGFRHLHTLIAAHGYADGIAAYNGDGRAAAAYSASVRARRDRWRQILHPHHRSTK